MQELGCSTPLVNVVPQGVFILFLIFSVGCYPRKGGGYVPILYLFKTMVNGDQIAVVCSLCSNVINDACGQL